MPEETKRPSSESWILQQLFYLSRLIPHSKIRQEIFSVVNPKFKGEDSVTLDVDLRFTFEIPRSMYDAINGLYAQDVIKECFKMGIGLPLDTKYDKIDDLP